MKISAIFGIFIAFTAWQPGALAETSPETIIERADAIRNPSESYRMRVKIDAAVFEVLIKGQNRTLVRQLQPARDRGRNLLMLEQDMWAYIPNVKRAVRVSLAQRLTGQAANGDISRMRWSGDYDVVVENQTASQWQLYLTAKKKGLTYDKLRAWVEKGSFKPLRAEYLSVSGKPLKTAVYGEYKDLAGKQRPSQILIQDAIRADEQSKIVIENMEIKTFPDSLFRQDNLGQSE
jgi:outer membrane lipoprotein-sorting protein